MIRRARPDDAHAVADTFVAARRGMTYLPVVHTERETRSFIADVVLRKQEVWVSTRDARVVGFAALSGDLLGHLYVHPDEQGCGLGTALLELAKRERPEGLRLWVFQRNEGARRFYERHGLSLVELTDGSGNDEHEPDALYEWKP